MNVPRHNPIRKPLGRPRRLSLSRIVEVAKEIGLENLTMMAVAKRLGVNGTVLYNYVSSRDDLVRLVAVQLIQSDLQASDRNQSWPVYVAEAASALYATLIGPGKLLAHFLTGGLGAEVEIDRTEAWLQKLTSAGFTVSDALLLYRRMGEIVIGAAVILLQSRALDQAGYPFKQSALKALDIRGSEVPLLVSEKEQFAARAPVWQTSIIQLIEEVAADRSETVDKDALKRAFCDAAQRLEVKDDGVGEPPSSDGGRLL